MECFDKATGQVLEGREPEVSQLQLHLSPSHCLRSGSREISESATQYESGTEHGLYNLGPH